MMQRIVVIHDNRASHVGRCTARCGGLPVRAIRVETRRSRIEPWRTRTVDMRNWQMTGRELAAATLAHERRIGRLFRTEDDIAELGIPF